MFQISDARQQRCYASFTEMEDSRRKLPGTSLISSFSLTSKTERDENAQVVGRDCRLLLINDNFAQPSLSTSSKGKSLAPAQL